MLNNAKILRNKQTEAELKLWYHLRAHRFLGLKFKRQKPMGRYIVDFICLEKRLIIEIDGGQHAEQERYDQQRDVWLRSQGFTVLRFWNNEVMQQLESVLEQIRCTISLGSRSRRCSTSCIHAVVSPDPSPASGRGDQEDSL
jgi:very-short-patch-repair endonuclease